MESLISIRNFYQPHRLTRQNAHANTIALNEKFIQTKQLHGLESHVWNVIVSEHNKNRAAKIVVVNVDLTVECLFVVLL